MTAAVLLPGICCCRLHVPLQAARSFLNSLAALVPPHPCSLCSAACGVPGGIFVHASGFIGGNRTLEGAVAMAAKALDLE